MPRRKINVEEAFAALDAAGIHVQVKQPEVIQEDNIEIIAAPTPLPKVSKIGEKNVRITLYAAHSIGHAGIAKGEKGNYYVEGDGVQQYGPGIVIVPSILAQHLLYQDMLARRADERMADKTFRSFIIVERRGNQGQHANVAVEVANLDMGDMLNSSSMEGVHRIG